MQSLISTPPPAEPHCCTITAPLFSRVGPVQLQGVRKQLLSVFSFKTVKSSDFFLVPPLHCWAHFFPFPICENAHLHPDWPCLITLCQSLLVAKRKRCLNMGKNEEIILSALLQLDPFYASIILFVGRAWDAVTDPTVGFLVSRSPWTRHGRMMPW